MVGALSWEDHGTQSMEIESGKDTVHSQWVVVDLRYLDRTHVWHPGGCPVLRGLHVHEIRKSSALEMWCPPAQIMMVMGDIFGVVGGGGEIVLRPG